MNARVSIALAGSLVIVGAAANGRADGKGQTGKPLEKAMGYYLEGAAAWRQDNPDYETGGEAPRFWIREFRWGPAHDVLVADAYAVFDGERCEPLMHFVHTWDSVQSRVTNQAFGPGGMHLQGSTWYESPTTAVTEGQGQLPNGSTLRIRDVSDLSDPLTYSSVGHRWEGEASVAGDTARWMRAPRRVCG